MLARKNGSLVVDFCDLMLQQKSPKARSEPEGRVEMGGSASRVAFGPLVNVVCTLVRSMHTATIQEDVAKTFMGFADPLDSQKPLERVSQKVDMTDEATEYFTNPDFIDLVIRCEYEIDSFADALAHVCFGNKKLSKDICKIALKAIAVSDYDRIARYLKVVQS